jgi:hypothetical protein
VKAASAYAGALLPTRSAITMPSENQRSALELSTMLGCPEKRNEDYQEDGAADDSRSNDYGGRQAHLRPLFQPTLAYGSRASRVSVRAR